MFRLAILSMVFAAFGAAPAAASLPQIPEAVSRAKLAHPHDLELSPDGRHLYVADLDNDRIAVLDPRTLDLVATIGAGQLGSPHDLTFDAQGRLLVADTANDRIAFYEISTGADGKPKGKLVASWDDELGGPEGVAAGPDGRVYVGNTGFGQLVVMQAGKAVRVIEEPAPGTGRFRRPHDVMRVRDGRLFVVDSGNHRIVVLDRALKPVAVLGGPAYGFQEPKYAAEGDDGLIYVADEYNNRIVVLGADLKPLGTIGTGKKGKAPGELNWPEAIFVKGADIWIADTYNNRVLRLKR